MYERIDRLHDKGLVYGLGVSSYGQDHEQMYFYYLFKGIHSIFSHIWYSYDVSFSI